MQRIKHFVFGVSIGVSCLVFGSILARGITLCQERINIYLQKNKTDSPKV